MSKEKFCAYMLLPKEVSIIKIGSLFKPLDIQANSYPHRGTNSTCTELRCRALFAFFFNKKEVYSANYRLYLEAVFDSHPGRELFQKQIVSFSAWVGSLAVASAGLFGPAAGRLTDRFGARAVVICGAILSAMSLLLTSLVPSLYLMLLTYGGIFGCGSSLVYIAVYEIVPRYFVKRRSLATGLITMSVGAGMVVMSPVCQALIDAFGWRGAFRGMSCIVLIIFFIGWTLDPNVVNDETEEAIIESEQSQARPLESSRILDFSMWENTTFVVLNITGLVVYIGHSIPPIHFVSNS